MMFIQPQTAIIVFGMFAIGAVALMIALRVKYHGHLERLSRSTKLWVLGLTIGVLLSFAGIVWMFRHVMHI